MERRVEFFDTDAAGIAHFTRILGFIEEAEHHLLDSLAIPVFGSDGGWPKVNVSIDYRAPIRAYQTVSIALGIEKMGASSITWRVKVSTGNLTNAEGTVTTVRVSELGKAQKIPQDWRDKLEALPTV